MTTSERLDVRIIAGLCLMLALFTVEVPAQIAVIVNKSVNVHSIKANEIYDIFSLNIKEWPDGTPIVVTTLKGNDATSQSMYAYLGTHLLEMKKIWMRVLLSGEGKAPATFNTEEEVLAKVASTPGAIGFVRKEKANGSVRIVAVSQ